MANPGGRCEGEDEGAGRRRLLGLFLGLVLVSVVLTGLVWREPGAVSPVLPAGPEGLSGLYGVGAANPTSTESASRTRSTADRWSGDAGAVAPMGPGTRGNGTDGAKGPRVQSAGASPLLGSGGFASIRPATLSPGLSPHHEGAGVALADLDHNGIQDMVVMGLDSDTHDFEYWVCRDANDTGACTGGMSARRTKDGPEAGSAGAGIALGDLDGSLQPDAIFMYIHSSLGAYAFRYWLCMNLSAAGDCLGGWVWWNSPSPGWNGLPIDFGPVLITPSGGGVALGDVDGNKTLDAVFTVVGEGRDSASFYALVCFDIHLNQRRGDCRAVTDLRWQGPTLPVGVDGAGVALAEMTGDDDLDLVLGGFYGGGYRYWVCPNLRGAVGYPIAECEHGLSKEKVVAGADIRGAAGGAIALATDLPRKRDLNVNGALDGVFLIVRDPDGDDRFDYWVALDGFIAETPAGFGLSSVPLVPYLIVHDPSGDSSQACFEKTTTHALATELSFTLGASLSARAEVLGISGGASVAFSASEANEITVGYTTGSRFCSYTGSDLRERTGPGYGDLFWGAQWDIEWFLVNVTTDLDGTVHTLPVTRYRVQAHSETTKYAYQIREDPDLAEWQDFLFALDLGARNAVPSEALRNRSWHDTTDSLQHWATVETTRQATAGFTFELDRSVGIGFGVGDADLEVTMAWGAKQTATTTEAGTNWYHIVDRHPETPEDRLDIDIYFDEAYGTLLFHTLNNGTDPRGDSRTSLPCEHWTACADTTPPELHSASVGGNLLTYDPGAGMNPPPFTVHAYLRDAGGIALAQANLTRVSSWRALQGVAEDLVVGLPSVGTASFQGVTWPDYGGSWNVQSTAGRMEGMYVVDIYAVDGDGNGKEYSNVAAMAVTRDGSAVAVTTQTSPAEMDALQFGANSPIVFNATPPAIDLSLAIESRSAVTNYSISVVQFTSYPNSTVDNATAGIFVEIEATQNLDDAVRSVVICVGYDPNNLPLNFDGSRVREETLHLKWFDHRNGTNGRWVELPYPRDSAGNEIPVDTLNHVVCGVSTHFSLYGPVGNFRPFADLGSIPAPVTEGTMLAFDASRSYDRDGTIVAYAWDFGDGSPVATGVAQSHAFGDDGTYPVHLTVTDDGGERGTATILIDVSNVPPQGTFTAVPGGDEGAALAFAFRGTDPGSDDLLFQWDYADGAVEVGTWYNDGGGPDGSVSPLGTFPFAATDDRVHAYGDDGAFWPTVTVCDDDGGCATVSSEVQVANVAPALSMEVVPVGPEGAILQFRASATDPGSDDLAFTWSGECVGWSSRTSWNDPTGGPDPAPSPTWNPREVADAQEVVCGDDGSFAWNLEVEDDDSGRTTLSGTFDVGNLPPSLAVSPPSTVMINEAAAVTLSATAVDPGSDDLTFAWAWEHGPLEVRAFHNDGLVPDPDHSPSGTSPFTAIDASTHTYGDDCVCRVTLMVTDDDAGSMTYETTVTVVNVKPVIEDVRVYAVADVTLRVAGEKWHDVRLDVEAYAIITDAVSVTRSPGSPDEQSATIQGSQVQLLGNPRLVITYTPEDDPPNGQPNGGTPIWVHVAFADGYAVEFHHTFTASRAGTWVLSMDGLRAHLVGRPLVFEVDASDAGSDDLTASWDFGDGGTDAEVAYNDGVGPDSDPSPEVRPLVVTFQATHAYAGGGFTATVTVTDDDGGWVARPVLLPL